MLGAVLSAVINMHLQGAYGALKSFIETVHGQANRTLLKNSWETLEESDAELLMGASEQLCVLLGLGMIIFAQSKIITSTHNKRLSH